MIRAPTDMSNTTPAGTGEVKPRNECGCLQARTERVSLPCDLREPQAGRGWSIQCWGVGSGGGSQEVRGQSDLRKGPKT